MINGFNIRVYAITEHKGRILILKEPFMDELIYKFPGGGLEFGEGTINCLKREFKEELNLDIENITHFYTQEEYIHTPIKKEKQLLLIYYKVNIKNIHTLEISDSSIQEIKWVKKEDLKKGFLSLPIDKIVIDKLFP